MSFMEFEYFTGNETILLMKEDSKSSLVMVTGFNFLFIS